MRPTYFLACVAVGLIAAVRTAWQQETKRQAVKAGLATFLLVSAGLIIGVVVVVAVTDVMYHWTT